jgi:hypothetical protein
LKGNEMKKGILTLTINLLLTLAFSPANAQNLRAGQSLNREKALAMLKGCSRSLNSEGCNEDTAEYLIGLHKRGDKALLEPLLDAGLVSDGALSASLGAFFGELLSKEPRTFLRVLSSRPRKEQRRLAWLAGAMDGSGMPKEMLREVRAKLSKIGAQRRNRLSSVARLSLSEVSRANSVGR